jgi:hypothetical protein
MVFPGLAVLGLAYSLFVVMDLLPYLIIGVACMIPLAVCLIVPYRFPRVIDRFPRIVLALIYLLCSVAMVWFLVSFGDDLLPVGSTTGGRHAVDATGNFLAAWTGLMLALFGIAGVWFMIADVLERRRKARVVKGGASPGSRRGRRDADKSSGRRPEQRR